MRQPVDVIAQRKAFYPSPKMLQKLFQRFVSPAFTQKNPAQRVRSSIPLHVTRSEKFLHNQFVAISNIADQVACPCGTLSRILARKVTAMLNVPRILNRCLEITNPVRFPPLPKLLLTYSPLCQQRLVFALTFSPLTLLILRERPHLHPLFSAKFSAGA
jgi:hypothetical protein